MFCQRCFRRANGKEFYCTQFAIVFLQCSIALGWQSRKLSIDTDHEINEEGSHHGIVDIWSEQYKKWYAIDPMNNLHFEKDGVPLNVLEIRQEYLKGSRLNVKGVMGKNKKNILYNCTEKVAYGPANYFWVAISLRNNFLEKPNVFDTKMLLWVDDYNKNKVWYKDGKKHPMYQSQFVNTSNQEIFFPKIS